MLFSMKIEAKTRKNNGKLWEIEMNNCHEKILQKHVYMRKKQG